MDYLCEAKLIILGEAGAGKTSLAHKIEDPNFTPRQDEKSTEGINVIRCCFPTAIRVREGDKERLLQQDFQVNIWDFGGQEIYHATHQFFLTRRSVYVLACDDRKEDTDFAYWLHVVELLSDASPLLIVQNEKQDRTRDINLSGLRARFANFAVPWQATWPPTAVSIASSRSFGRSSRICRTWASDCRPPGSASREALEHDTRDYISLEEYLDICQRHGFVAATTSSS